ncbi:MBG domain-containing protein [Marinibaculum pumilum]|uniref:MBG domain-containing protein n=1 Tax=Marinibaculum pumilum TaxID=1766165 RepID=A0ABV7KW46_9PROT
MNNRYGLQTRLLAGTALVFGLAPLAPLAAQELPAGGQVTHGAATVSQPAAGRMVVDQTSARAILSWQSFSVGQGGEVAFRNGAGATLNRVAGALPSRIDGRLSATGSVYLVNPAGIVVGSTGRIATGGGFIASTHDIADGDFLRGGPLTFAGRSDAAVVNAGQIGASGGDVALIARRVENSGSIEAPNGTAALAAGYEVLVSDAMTDGGRFAVKVGGAGTEVRSDGAVRAAVAELRANGGHVYALAGNTEGVIAATGVARRDGRIFLTAGGGGKVTTGGRISALAAGGEGARPGGAIELSGDTVTVGGDLSAASDSGPGGSVSVQGDLVVNTGSIRAGGTRGGTVDIGGRAILNAGIAAAGASEGQAGTVRVRAAESYVEIAGAGLRADGAVDGGTIAVSAERLFTSGLIAATGRGGRGGRIELQGGDIDLAAARLDAGGAHGGGTILLGGGLRGDGGLRHAATLDASAATGIRADAWTAGDGGLVVLWSDQATGFFGRASARGGATGGDGGLIEVSSKGQVAMGGTADAGAPQGRAGALLLDPRDITISDLTGIFPQYPLVDPNPSPNNSFGNTIVHLQTDTVVVTAPNDDAGGADAGAVYLFDESSGALLSTLIGGTPDDQVGTGVTALENGHFVVSSPSWDNGAVVNAGAVTWGSGTTGINGTVSAANSLVGSTPADQVGINGVVPLANGNYVAISPNWDNGGVADTGAVTWGNGVGGTAGAVTAANSIVGSTASDNVGSGGVTALSSGNFVVASPFWDNFDAFTPNVGAVMWADGLGGTVGAVTAGRALVGSTLGDQVGGGSVVELANGNYVVVSPAWNNGGVISAGAVTWGDGAAGRTGAVDPANSLVGSNANDLVGSFGVTALTNGNYVVASPLWDNGGLTDAGAATWGDGAAGSVGEVAAANSLVGTIPEDQVAATGVVALANGNYLVLSALWDNGGIANAGAATWGDGAVGTSGAVTAVNSQVGSTPEDQVGNGGAAALSNGNYVTASPFWDNGGIVDAGAASWGDGATGSSGAVSAANSLVGSTASDQIGFGGVTALDNGNYVVASPLFDSAGSVDAGAATWATGAAATAAAVSSANSLVGVTPNDQVADGGVTALTNGNYVVLSSSWINGVVDRAGAATWGDGAAGTFGAVSAANSLFGSTTDDLQGTTVLALSNGDYALASPSWDNGVLLDAGAVAVGDGTAGTTGAISGVNAMTGGATMELFGGAMNVEGDTTLIVGSPFEGRAVVGMLDINADTGGLIFARAQGQDITIAPSAVTGVLDSGTDLALQASNDIFVTSPVLADNRSVASLTLEAGRSINVGANIRVGGTLTLIANTPQAAGVVEADRAAGPAVIDTLAATLTSGGAMDLELADGAGRAANDSGGIMLGAISAPSLTVLDAGPSAGTAIAFSSSITTTGSQIYSGDLFVGVPAVALTSTGGAVTWATEGADTITGGPGAEIRMTDASGLIRYGLLDPADAARISFGGTDSRLYGDSNPDLAQPLLTAGSLRPGDNLGSLFAAGAGLSGAVPTATSNAGGYVVAIDGSGAATSLTVPGYFVTTQGAGTLTVLPRPISVAADAQSRVYGDANPPLTYTIGGSGLANGDTLAGGLATAATAASSVGSYAITQGSLAASANYSLSFTEGQLQVAQRPLAVTADPQSRRYGDTNPALTYTIGGAGLANGDTLSGGLATAATAASSVGSYAITQGSLAATANYSLSFTEGQLQVTQRPITVTAESLSRSYGDANPSLTYQVGGAGLANGDLLGGALATAAGTASPVGSYAIAQGSLAASSNYSLSFTEGQLQVTQRPIAVTAMQRSRAFGTANPELVFAIAQGSLAGGDAISLATTADQASVPGSYDIMLDGLWRGGLDVASNYDLTYRSALLTVLAAPVQESDETESTIEACTM